MHSVDDHSHNKIDQILSLYILLAQESDTHFKELINVNPAWIHGASIEP